MRRDICYAYEKDLITVYRAYVTAIQSKLGKTVSEQPYRSLSFALNFSMKYNMNGGSCTVHFMPYGQGTAVGVRYSVAQAAGARYGAHCEVYTARVQAILGVIAMPTALSVDDFLDPEKRDIVANTTFAAIPDFPIPMPSFAEEAHSPVEENDAPVDENDAPVEEIIAPMEEIPAPVEDAPAYQLCAACGAKIKNTDRFCMMCGQPTVAPVEETPAPVEEIIVSVAENDALVDKNDAPVEEIVAPVEETPAPVEEIIVSVEENDAPAEENDAPAYKLCAACGAKIKDTDRFCMMCGARQN